MLVLGKDTGNVSMILVGKVELMGLGKCRFVDVVIGLYRSFVLLVFVFLVKNVVNREEV